MSNGYDWSKWTQTSGGADVSTTKAYQFTMGTSNISYTANASAHSYTITYTLNSGTHGTTHPSTYKITDNDFTISDPTRTGYTFSGWTVQTAPTAWGTGSSTSGSKTFKVAKGTYGDITFSAGWTANTNTAYVVNHYKKDLGATTYTLDSTENKTGTSDASLTIADLKKTITGFTYSEGFAGTQATGTTKPASGAVTTTTILANGTRVINLYYTRDTHTVTLTSGTGIASTTGAGTYEYGASVTLGATMSNGYDWSKWTQTSGGADVSTTKAYQFTMGTSNISYTANASAHSYTITYTLNSGTHGTTHPSTYKITDNDFTISDPTRTGYTFSGWTVTTAPTAWGTGSSTSGSKTFKVAKGTYGDITFSAGWTANTNTAYVVNHYTKNLGATTYTLNSTENKTGTTDSTVTLANVKKSITGFSYSEGFAGTQATGTTKPASGAVTTTTVLANGTRVINLYYTRDSHTVTLTSGTGISGTTGAGTYEYGATVTLGATMSNGYDWSKWTQTSGGADVSTTKAYQFTMGTSNITYTANASVHSYTITYTLNSGSHGTTHPSTYKITDNDFTISNPSRTGFTFTGWTVTTAPTAWGSGSSSSGSKNFKVAKGTYGDITFSAGWTANTNTAYVVNHYKKDLGATTYTLDSTENKTGTTDSTVTLANVKKTITGFTYSEGFAGTQATGTTKPASGAVTTTTILANGTRVINLYYTRNTYTVTLTKGTGIDTVSGAGTYEYGATVTLGATAISGYSFSKWTQTSNGTQVSTTNAYSTTISGNWAYTANAVDSEAPNLSLSATTYLTEDFSDWFKNNVTISNGVATLSTNGSMTTPFYQLNNCSNWYVDFEFLTQTASTNFANGGILLGSNYYDSNIISKKASNNYEGNGYALGATAFNTWTHGTWNGWSAWNIDYLRLSFSTSNTYSQPPVQLRNVKIYCNTMKNTFYDIIISSSDNVGVTTTKFASGQQNASYFASNGELLTENSKRVTSNGYYTIYVADAQGNSKVEQIQITNIASSITCPTGYTTSGVGKCLANTYTIGYTMNGGSNPSTKPTSGTYGEDVEISNPGSKTVTVTGDANGLTGLSIGSATSATQTFAGWTSTTMGSNAKSGSTTNNYATWTGTSTTNTHFKNLKESGTVTMVANWNTSATTLPSLSKTGYICKWYSSSGTSGGTLLGIGGDSYTPSSTASNVPVYARCSANTNTAYVVNHYKKDLGATTYTLNSTENKTGTSDASVTLADLKKTITGFTYSEGFAGTQATGTTKPASGAVTTTTILANGTRVINLYYTRDTHTVTLTSGTGIASTTGAGTYEYGASVTLGATMSNGYDWSKWTQTSGGADVSTTKAYQFTMGTSNITYTANASVHSYTITYTLNSGSHGTTHPSTYKITDNDFTISDPTRTGYTFSGWTVSTAPSAWGTGSSTSGSKTFKVAKGTYGDITFSAGWTANTNTAYVVNHYKKDLGATTYTLDSTENKTGTTDSTVTLANVKKSITGFTYSEGFAGTAATGTTKPASGAVTTTTVLANGTRVINLYYTRDSHTVTLTSGTGISGTTGAGTYEYGASVTLGATMSNGYDWSKWTQTSGGADVSTTKAYQFTMGTSNITYTANASVHSYTITYTLNSGTHGTTHPSTYKITDNDFTISDPTRTGYTFSGWTVSTAPTAWGTGSSTSGSKTFKVAKGTYGDITFSAGWTANTYTVNYSCGDGSGTAPASVTATYDQTFTTATTAGTCSKTGYTFSGYKDPTGASWTNWSGTWKYVNGQYGITNNSLTLTAQWTPNTYTIGYTMNGGPDPTTKPTSGTYDSNVQISNPGSKTVTVTGNANGLTGLSIGNATSATQTFAGWTSTTMGSNAKSGSTTSNYATWTGTSTKNTYFKNLKESGTVTMVANWNTAATTLPTLSKTGWTCKWYSSSGTSGGTELGSGGDSYTPSATASSVTVYARCSVNAISNIALASNPINGGETTQVTYSGDAKTKTFTSSDTSVATVDSNGVVTGTGNGTATITVSLTDYAGTTTTKTLNITVILMAENISYSPPSGATCNGGTCSDVQLMIDEISRMLD